MGAVPYLVLDVEGGILGRSNEVRGVSSGVVSRSQTAATMYLILSNGVRSIQAFAISSVVEFGF